MAGPLARQTRFRNHSDALSSASAVSGALSGENVSNPRQGSTVLRNGWRHNDPGHPQMIRDGGVLDQLPIIDLYGPTFLTVDHGYGVTLTSTENHTTASSGQRNLMSSTIRLAGWSAAPATVVCASWSGPTMLSPLWTLNRPIPSSSTSPGLMKAYTIDSRAASSSSGRLPIGACFAFCRMRRASGVGCSSEPHWHRWSWSGLRARVRDCGRRFGLSTTTSRSAAWSGGTGDLSWYSARAGQILATPNRRAVHHGCMA